MLIWHNKALDNFRFVEPLQGRTSIRGAPYARSASKTLQARECPGCFSPLRSEQGTVSLAPFCGYPHRVKGVTFAVTPFIFYCLVSIPLSAAVPIKLSYFNGRVV